MSFGWLHRICETDLGEDLYSIYLGSVARWGGWYVHPIGEPSSEISPGRRCFTRRGAEQMRREFNASEMASAEPVETFRMETSDTIISHHSYPVEAVWVVSRWQDPPPPEVTDSAEMLQNAITRDIFFPYTP